ncbi:hypothetical protein HYALB_00005808 [Hymenoscyphus albidus]|uniref:Uncharacterized protein n=1 Tax=Hymenoscyphus albidus TaxID=595503 RepID=A0A9N9Q5L5_9HELO|nr:hypothetical protein HYALB_00005808 [Hymenoscyphus albidus]
MFSLDTQREDERLVSLRWPGEEDICIEVIDVSDPGTVSETSRGNFYSPSSILYGRCCESLDDMES